VGNADLRPVPSPGPPGDGTPVPGNAAEAIGMVLAGLGWLAQADFKALPTAVQAECLRELENARSVQAAAHASILSAFDRAEGYAEDGQGTVRTWLRWQTQVTSADAAASVAWMRTLRAHPRIADALAGMRVTLPVARLLCTWSDKLPESRRAEADKLLLDSTAAGLGLADLAKLVEQMLAALAEPDEDPDKGFADRRLKLATTYGGAGYLEGDLTPQCAEAMKAVLDALGKKMGPEDVRTAAQRRHDALAEACRRLIASGCLPDRAGQPTQIQLHIGLDELLRRLDSPDSPDSAGSSGVLGQAVGKGGTASGLSDLATLPQPAGGLPLAGPGDECDASIVPIVTGFLDHELLDKLIAAVTGPFKSADLAADGTPKVSLNADSVRDLFIANAAALFTGPRGLASWLRRRELDGIAGSVSLPLDTGQPTETIPPHLRRAVIARDRHCAAPGCDQAPAACSVHHIRWRSKGGVTKLSNLLLLCSFHHLILVHRWGWTINLNADGTTTMRSPDGAKIFHSHGPPTVAA
jgi:Domain of unknown function (DUF222)